MSKRLLFMLALTVFLAAGCNLIYKQNIQQGNALEQEDLDQLRLGMSMNQVAYLLGTPAVQDPFHHDRWDYVSWFSRRGGKPTERRVTLTFENGTLAAMEGVDQAGAPDAADLQSSAPESRPEDTQVTVAEESEASAPAMGEASETSDPPVVTPLETPAATEGPYVETGPETPMPVATEPDLETGPVDRTATDAVEEMASAQEINEALTQEEEAASPVEPQTGEWLIQLGAFDSEENATRVLDRLDAAGYPAVLTRRITQGTDVRFLVRQPDIASRSEALRLLEEIDEELGINGFLVPAGN